jgi:hypothetical protein
MPYQTAPEAIKPHFPPDLLLWAVLELKSIVSVAIGSVVKPWAKQGEPLSRRLIPFRQPPDVPDHAGQG